VAFPYTSPFMYVEFMVYDLLWKTGSYSGHQKIIYS
jgi:hypothetical protein